MGRVVVDEALEDLTGLGPGDELVGCTLVGLAGEALALDGLRLEACRVVDAHLRLATVRGTRLTDVAFLGCTLVGVDWTAADWPGFGLGGDLRFAGCTLDLGTFAGVALPGLLLYGCSARDVDFGGCDLTGADLRHSDLTDARFDGADLTRADLTGAVGYDFALADARHAGMAVSLPEAAAFLRRLGLEVRPASDRDDPVTVLDAR